MVRKRKSCSACWYYRKRCSLDCPLAPYFPSNQKGEEDFQNVVKVFGESNFTKLMNSAQPHQRLAAETMIMEARARRSDPVHGLPGIAETLSKKLNDLTSQLASVNHQNQFHWRHSAVVQQEPQQCQSNEASSSLQEVDSSLTQHDELTTEFAPYKYHAIKPYASPKSAYTHLGDAAIAKLKENSNQCSSGVVLKCSNDAKGLTKTSAQDHKSILQNYTDNVNLCQENNGNVECFMDVEEPAPNFIQGNKADMKNCIDLNEWLTNMTHEVEETTAKYSHHLKEEQEGKKKKPCAACKYRRIRCPPGCPLAPIFPADKGGEDFQNVAFLFGPTNFIKLMKLAQPQQCLAAETIKMEARFRMCDPVHGLSGIVETLSQQLDNLTSELASVNQQVKFLRRHNVAQSDEAKAASSSELTAVTSPLLEEDGSSILTDIDQFL